MIDLELLLLLCYWLRCSEDVLDLFRLFSCYELSWLYHFLIILNYVLTRYTLLYRKISETRFNVGSNLVFGLFQSIR